MYKYNDQLYTSTAQVDEAIIERIGSNYNNRDVSTTAEFEREWEEVEELGVSWDTFKMWCNQNGLKTSHATSVEKFMKEVKE